MLSRCKVLFFIIFLRHLFLCVHLFMIKDNKSNQWSSVSCRTEVVGKCVGSQPIHYNFNLDVVSSYMVLANLIMCFH